MVLVKVKHVRRFSVAVKKADEKQLCRRRMNLRHPLHQMQTFLSHSDSKFW